jgi:hypothetical protein
LGSGGSTDAQFFKIIPFFDLFISEPGVKKALSGKETPPQIMEATLVEHRLKKIKGSTRATLFTERDLGQHGCAAPGTIGSSAPTKSIPMSTTPF